MESNNLDEILSREEACAYLKISKGTLKKLCIPTVHLGRRVVYQKSAILAFLKKNTKVAKK